MRKRPWFTIAALAAQWAACAHAFVSFEELMPLVGRDRYCDGQVASDVATGGNGTWIVVTHGSGGTLYERSADGGATWSGPLVLTDASVGPGVSYPGQIATDGAGTWVAIYAYRFTDETDLYARRSIDDGQTWSPAVLVDPATAPSDTTHERVTELATNGLGTWVATWIKGDCFFDCDPRVYVSRSTDDGSTWSQPELLGTSDALGIRVGRAPIGADTAGNWVVAWSSDDDLGGTIGTDSDVLFVRSTDDGATWTSAAPLNSNAASDSGHDGGPDVEAATDGTWIAVWGSNDSLNGQLPALAPDLDIFLARSTDAGATWSAPSPLNATAYGDYGEDELPIVATDGVGNWMVGWSSDSHHKISGDDDVFYARSRDAGLTWTPPVLLNHTATADDDITDCVDSIAADAAGTWMASIQQTLEVPAPGPIALVRSIRDCPATPSATCKSSIPAGSKLAIRQSIPFSDSLKWNYTGPASLPPELGDPSTSDYVLCLYDQSAGLPSVELEKEARAGGTCRGKPCWRTSSSGFFYKDGARLRGAVSNLSIKTAGTRTAIKLKAGGQAVAPPFLPLASDTAVITQFHNLETGACWEAVFSSPSANYDRAYKATSD